MSPETRSKLLTFFIRARLLVLLTTGFAIATPCAAYLSEEIKKFTATQLGYETRFDPELQHSRYFNEPLKDAMRNIQATFPLNDDGYLLDPEWMLLNASYTRSHSLIDLSGRLFNLVVSMAGLCILLTRRKRKKPMGIIDYTALVMSFFFLRDVVMDTLNIYYHYLLDEDVILWNRLGISPITSITIFSILCLLLTGFILYKIPRDRLIVIASGCIGIYFGLRIWLNHTEFIQPRVIKEIPEDRINMQYEHPFRQDSADC